MRRRNRDSDISDAALAELVKKAEAIMALATPLNGPATAVLLDSWIDTAARNHDIAAAQQAMDTITQACYGQGAADAVVPAGYVDNAQLLENAKSQRVYAKLLHRLAGDDQELVGAASQAWDSAKRYDNALTRRRVNKRDHAAARGAIGVRTINGTGAAYDLTGLPIFDGTVYEELHTTATAIEDRLGESTVANAADLLRQAVDLPDFVDEPELEHVTDPLLALWVIEETAAELAPQPGSLAYELQDAAAEFRTRLADTAKAHPAMPTDQIVGVTLRASSLAPFNTNQGQEPESILNLGSQVLQTDLAGRFAHVNKVLDLHRATAPKYR